MNQVIVGAILGFLAGAAITALLTITAPIHGFVAILAIGLACCFVGALVGALLGFKP